MKTIYYVIIIVIFIILTIKVKGRTPKKTIYQMCINHIMEYEGFSPTPYKLGSFKYIGFGHQIRNNDKFKITIDEAEELLVIDFNKRIDIARKMYPTKTINKHYAIALFMYNLGSQTWRNSSMNKMLNGTLDYTPEMFIAVWSSYCKYGNRINQKLVERRNFELKLYFNE
jgi:GH24 family phage-related lysozyme (muramidase)